MLARSFRAASHRVRAHSKICASPSSALKPRPSLSRIAESRMAASSSSHHSAGSAAAAASGSSFNLPKNYGNFSLSAGPVSLQESYNQPITVSKYTSEKTGLRVVLIDVEGAYNTFSRRRLRCRRLVTDIACRLCNQALCATSTLRSQRKSSMIQDARIHSSSQFASPSTYILVQC
jgi:hypothetical protein